ncbi:MAG: hypothetical protein NC231_04365 [Bacillus sp. (in: Bacteria)]|nr:hypothetical protein [Bacillus sp. (in: firmicutes)]MCM1425304.1 hypothetical protein [Eubacterium sp.]
MLLLKANPELKKVFGTLVKAMKVPVTWTDTFIIMNNNLILAGDIRSLIFDFDNKKVSTNIIEVPTRSAQLESMPSDTLLNNVMNMILYAFGKWGAINVKVDKDYAALNALFENVLRPVNIEPGFSAQNFRFFKEGIQITYEDTMLAILRLLKNEGKLREGQSLATSENKAQDESSDTDETIQDGAGQRKIEETEEDYDYQIGLWHNLCWKKAAYDFQKSPQTEEDTVKSRIGRDFYITNYICPNCGQKLYLGVYPTDRELLIDTEEGRVFMARTYACDECNTLYTPRPGKLLQEGDVYHLQFDEDRIAYEDYLDILGDKAARTTNYKFNEFESERGKKANTETADEIATDDNKNDTVSYHASNAADSVLNDASNDDIPPAHTSGLKAIKERLSKNTARQDDSQSELPHAEKTEISGTKKTTHTTPDSTPTEPAPDTSYLTQKSTDELKAILEHLERSDKASLSQFGVSAPNSEYIDMVTDILHEKLTAKYDARMGVLNRLSFKQLADLRKQITKETVFSDEEKDKYRKKIDNLLYEAEANALKQKVEECRNKSYAEIEQMIDYVESREILDELKQETIQKLKTLKAGRAVREVEHLLTQMPVNINRQQLAVYLEKLDQYKEVDLTPYRRQLEERKNMAEIEEISAMVKRSEKKDRIALWNLYEQLQQLDYSKENKEPFLEKIYDKIRRMDEAKIEKICPSLVTFSFSEGLDMYEQIKKGVFLPELKTNTLEMIQRRLTKLKTDESVQLMRKLKKNMEEKLSDRSGLYFYDAREELKKAQNAASQNRTSENEENDGNESPERMEEENAKAAMRRAINGYASSRDQYEYPLMVCDSSRAGNGKEGFVLTPDHIFCHTFLNSNIVAVADIDTIKASKKLFGKGIFVTTFTGEKIKLPNAVNTKNWKAFSEVLDSFTDYLQEKPESRSIEYMSKEKHDIIRCYRCGYAYKGGNVCPKCGSKMNK